LPVPADEQPEQVADVTATEHETASESSTATDKPTKKKRVRVRSMKVDPKVERKVTEVPVPAEQRLCSVCNCEMQVFGHVDHEVIKYVPARIVVEIERRDCQ
jgi:3D (Asp-Asp-Asp) domain-containing protein